MNFLCLPGWGLDLARSPALRDLLWNKPRCSKNVFPTQASLDFLLLHSAPANSASSSDVPEPLSSSSLACGLKVLMGICCLELLLGMGMAARGFSRKPRVCLGSAVEILCGADGNSSAVSICRWTLEIWLHPPAPGVLCVPYPRSEVHCRQWGLLFPHPIAEAHSFLRPCFPAPALLRARFPSLAP